MEIIDMLPHTFINEGDEILLPSPEYTPMPGARSFRRESGGCDPDKNFEYTLEDFTARSLPKQDDHHEPPECSHRQYGHARNVEKLCQTDCIVVVDEVTPNSRDKPYATWFPNMKT